MSYSTDAALAKGRRLSTIGRVGCDSLVNYLRERSIRSRILHGGGGLAFTVATTLHLAALHQDMTVVCFL